MHVHSDVQVLKFALGATYNVSSLAATSHRGSGSFSETSHTVDSTATHDENQFQPVVQLSLAMYTYASSEMLSEQA